MKNKYKDFDETQGRFSDSESILESKINRKEEPLDSSVSEDKYLALEQPGVSYTPVEDPAMMNSDDLPYTNSNSEITYSDNEASQNAKAFSQDDSILKTNIDLDEDQNTSISSDDPDVSFLES